MGGAFVDDEVVRWWVEGCIAQRIRELEALREVDTSGKDGHGRAGTDAYGWLREKHQLEFGVLVWLCLSFQLQQRQRVEDEKRRPAACAGDGEKGIEIGDVPLFSLEVSIGFDRVTTGWRGKRHYLRTCFSVIFRKAFARPAKTRLRPRLRRVALRAV